MRIARQEVIKRLKAGEKLRESGNTMMFIDGDTCSAATEIYLRVNDLVKISGRLGHRVYSLK